MTKERQFLNLPNAWRADKIKKEQSKVTCTLNFFSIDELLDISPEPNSIYIHSTREPFNDEMEIDYQRLESWLEHFSLNIFQSHCSGHAYADDLFDLVRQINAKTIFFVHTEHPNGFSNVVNNLTIVEEDKVFQI